MLPCKELKNSLKYLVILMANRGEDEQMYHSYWTEGDPIQRVPFKKSLRTKVRTADSLSKPSPTKTLKWNFAHQTSSHAHAHEKLCLLASSWRQLYGTDTHHYRHNMHCIIQNCTQVTSASLGTCRMRVLCLNDRVVQGGGQEALIHRPLPCRRKPKRQCISWSCCRYHTKVTQPK